MVKEYSGLCIGGPAEGQRFASMRPTLQVPSLGDDGIRQATYHFEGANGSGFWRFSEIPLAVALAIMVESYLVRRGVMRDGGDEVIRVTEDKVRDLVRVKDRNGEYLFTPSAVIDQPATFLGIPIEIVEPKR